LKFVNDYILFVRGDIKTGIKAGENPLQRTGIAQGHKNDHHQQYFATDTAGFIVTLNQPMCRNGRGEVTRFAL